MTSKFGDLIKEARKSDDQRKENENQNTREPEYQNTRIELDVNLCVKVPLSLRRHWSAEAKREGVTLTSVIVAALSERFGASK